MTNNIPTYSTGKARHFLIILSGWQYLTGLLAAVMEWFRRWEEVTIMRYTGKVEEVEAVVHSNYRTKAFNNVLVFCSHKHTLSIFQQVQVMDGVQ